MSRKKIDIRFTDEQHAWIESEAEKRTISKSAYIRMVLEEMRRADAESLRMVAEESVPYSKPPVPKNKKQLDPFVKSMLDQTFPGKAAAEAEEKRRREEEKGA